MQNENLGSIMLRESARALPWGIMLLIVIGISGMWLKQEAKEAIEFTVAKTFHEAKQAVLDVPTFTRIKQNTKEAIQYASRTAANEYVRAQKQLQQEQ